MGMCRWILHRGAVCQWHAQWHRKLFAFRCVFRCVVLACTGADTRAGDLQEFLRGHVDKRDSQIKRARDKLAAEQGGRLTLSKETQAQVDEMAAQIKELQVSMRSPRALACGRLLCSRVGGRCPVYAGWDDECNVGRATLVEGKAVM